MKKRYLATFALVLTGCMPATPVVSDYNGASVKIQTSTMANAEEVKANAQAEANRICGKTGKRAEYASTTTDPNTYTAEHLFLCL